METEFRNEPNEHNSHDIGLHSSHLVHYLGWATNSVTVTIAHLSLSLRDLDVAELPLGRYGNAIEMAMAGGVGAATGGTKGFARETSGAAVGWLAEEAFAAAVAAAAPELAGGLALAAGLTGVGLGFLAATAVVAAIYAIDSHLYDGPLAEPGIYSLPPSAYHFTPPLGGGPVYTYGIRPDGVQLGLDSPSEWAWRGGQNASSADPSHNGNPPGSIASARAQEIAYANSHSNSGSSSGDLSPDERQERHDAAGSHGTRAEANAQERDYANSHSGGGSSSSGGSSGSHDAARNHGTRAEANAQERDYANSHASDPNPSHDSSHRSGAHDHSGRTGGNGGNHGGSGGHPNEGSNSGPGNPSGNHGSGGDHGGSGGNHGGNGGNHGGSGGNHGGSGGNHGGSSGPSNSHTGGHGHAPVLIDLNGDGFDVDTLAESQSFVDLTGNGYQTRTAWAGEGTGVLMIDADHDGKISNQSEFAFTKWDESAESDLAAVKSVFDSNHNGKLDASDARWADFKVSVNGQLVTLASLGITSIDLTPGGSGQSFADGSAITGTAAYTRSNGTTGMVGDAVLASEGTSHIVTQSVAAGCA